MPLFSCHVRVLNLLYVLLADAYDKRCLQVSRVEEDVGVAVELLVDHEGEDAHHGGAALVQPPDGELKEADEEEDLRHTGEGDLVQGGNASGDILEADGEILGEISGETESGRGPEVAEEGKHADAAVLEL